MFIGLDLGTSGLKGLLISDTQQVLAEATVPLSVSRPKGGWSEQAPADWVSAAERVFDSLAASAGLADVQAIGLSGQMHGATLLDASDAVLRPCILWNDTRASVEAAEMDDDLVWRQVSGNIVFPGFTAPKLEWVRRNEPDIFDKVAKVLLPKDYLRLWLTGDYVAEMSDAAGTSWLDTGARMWSGDLLAKTGLSKEHMPRLVEGDAPSGYLRSQLAARWGFQKHVVVAGGGGDNAASAVGMGVVHSGQAFVSLGTSGVLFAATDGYRPDPETAVHTFCHAFGDMWHQMGVILAATDALNWYAGMVGKDVATLTKSINHARPPGKTVFLPYLGGERTPLNSASVRAAFLGLEHQTDEETVTRAVMDGVAFALADCHAALEATGTQVTSIFAIGGGSQSTAWLETIATVINVPLSVPAGSQFGAAFGAARLGMIALTGDRSIATPPPVERTIDPIANLHQSYAEGYERFKTAARFLKDFA